MRGTRTFNAHLLLALLLAVAGTWLWIAHGRARDLGRASDVLGYDPAEYAVAARELAEHGRLATPFALPVELSGHARPPWPLALVQPGLLLGEAALFRLSGEPSAARLGWLVLVIPFVSYLSLGLALALGAAAFLDHHAESVPPGDRWLAAFVVGAALLLDPEAQHYATGGFTELPFAAGLALALAWLVAGAPPAPFRYGLLLGLTGSFRGNMLWLAPLLAVALASRWPGRGRESFLRVLAGYAVVLAPWWLYKWWAFGTPAWDLSTLSLWDGVGGRTWFSLNHLPSLPELPRGLGAVPILMSKLWRNLPPLTLELATGPRTLWIAGLAVTLLPAAQRRPPIDATPAAGSVEPAGRAGDPARAAALAILLMLFVTLIVTGLTVPLLRYLLPVRLLAEAAGLLGVWAYLWRLPDSWASATARRVLCVAIACLALGWGIRQTARGLAEATAASHDRGVPSTAVLQRIAGELDRQLPPGEPVMSNLGPTLAWYTRRPVVHLALTPADIDACRQRLDVRNVVLVFRGPSRAWPGWDEMMERPMEAPHHVEWNVLRVRRWAVAEDFTVVWLELGPLRAPMALAGNPATRGRRDR